MHHRRATDLTQEASPADTETHYENETWRGYAGGIDDRIEHLDDRLLSIECKLSDYSEKINSYREWLKLGLYFYLIAFFVGPVLDALHEQQLPDFGVFQWALIIERPYLWLSAWLIFSPSKYRKPR